MGQRSALRTLQRLAYIESLRLALSGPSRSKYGSVVVLPADLQALAHVASALCVVFEISPIEAAEAQPRLHVLHHAEVLKVRHLGYIGRCRRHARTTDRMAQEFNGSLQKPTLVQIERKPMVDEFVQELPDVGYVELEGSARDQCDVVHITQRGRVGRRAGYGDAGRLVHRCRQELGAPLEEFRCAAGSHRHPQPPKMTRCRKEGRALARCPCQRN